MACRTVLSRDDPHEDEWFRVNDEIFRKMGLDPVRLIASPLPNQRIQAARIMITAGRTKDCPIAYSN